MTILQVIRNFMKEGGKVFSQASRGEYEDSSPHIQALRDSIMGVTEVSGAAIDRSKLKRDRDIIASDWSAVGEYIKMHIKSTKNPEDSNI